MKGGWGGVSLANAPPRVITLAEEKPGYSSRRALPQLGLCEVFRSGRARRWISLRRSAGQAAGTSAAPPGAQLLLLCEGGEEEAGRETLQ